MNSQRRAICTIFPEVVITSVDVYVLRSPNLETDVLRDETALVVVATDVGVKGYGEANSYPVLIKHFLESERPHPRYRGARDALVGKTVDLDANLKELRLKTFGIGRTGLGATAVAAVETALYDLVGKIARVPVWQLIVQDDVHEDIAETEITPYITLFNYGPYEILISKTKDEIDRARAFGFKAIKIEPLYYNTSNDEAGRFVEDVRAYVGEDYTILVDTGYRWHSYDEAADVLKRITEIKPLFLEDPFPAQLYEEWRRAYDETGLDLATGGGLTSMGEFVASMELGGVRVVQPGPHTVGIQTANEVTRLAFQKGCHCVPFGYCATSITVAAIAHLAKANPNIPIVEYAPPALFPDALLRASVAGPEPKVVEGVMQIPDGPGLGVEVDFDAVERFQLS